MRTTVAWELDDVAGLMRGAINEGQMAILPERDKASCAIAWLR